MFCISDAQFTMKATVLRGGVEMDATVPEDGRMETRQDPDSGEITYIWIEGTDAPNNPETRPLEYTINCLVKGYADLGPSSTTSPSDDYRDGFFKVIEYVQLRYPADLILTKKDRITNVRNRQNKILFIEEEQLDNPATVFGVEGQVPITDMFGNHVYSTSILRRVETQ